MKAVAALSGGGIRAVAHLGVIEVLHAHGIEIEAIAGSSGGALMGALLCDGKEPEEILELLKRMRFSDMVRGAKRGGLFGLKGVAKRLGEALSCEMIEELPIDFTVAATDLAGGEIHYFDKGPIVDLCIASSALVPIFSPVPYGDLLLADGGFMDNMPTTPLLEMDRPIIGINVNPILPAHPKNSIQTTYRALTLMMKANVEASRTHCDFYIEPVECGAINILDITRFEEAYTAGKRAAEAEIEKILGIFT